MKNKKGFTLLELLVVVLIIGILAGIALPQYRKSVERARLSEVLVNIKAIEDSMDRYLLANGFPGTTISFKDFGDIELSGGEWVNCPNCEYQIENRTYGAFCNLGSCTIDVFDSEDFYSSACISLDIRGDIRYRSCFTNNTDKGRSICKYLETLGWEYIDEEY